MKTNILIHSLSKKEQQFFEKNVIKNHKRKTLQKLYKALKKANNLDKEVLYKKVFGDPYTTKKDALLRNELRLLNNAIELFLVESKWREELEPKSVKFQLDLLAIYLQKKNFSLFEQLWRKLYKKVTTERLYSEKVRLVHLWLDYNLQKEEFDFEVYKELRKLLEVGLAATLSEHQEQFKKLEVKHAFVERVMRALNVEYRPKGQPYHFDITPDLENKDITTYLNQVILNYSLDGKEKIAAGEKALEHTSAIYNYEKYAEFAESVLLLKGNIGLEYFLSKEYEKANQIYRSLLQESDKIPLNKRVAFFYNHFVNLICLGNYQQALEWRKENKSNWIQNPSIYYRVQFLSCWCYIFQEDYQTPMELLSSSDIYERPENDFMYAKTLLAIMHFHHGDFEFAERELYNLKQKNRYQRPMEEIYVHYARLFYRHLQALKELNPPKRNRRLDKLIEELDEFYISELGHTASVLYYKWYMRENQRARL